jgi:hypothetical protein
MNDEQLNPSGIRAPRPAAWVTSRPRGELAWQVTKDRRSMTCELFNAERSGAGWEVVVRLDGEWQFGRWCADEAVARFAAQSLKQDHLRGGWVE